MTAALAVDSQCTLGEGLLWDGRRDALLWTDIERATLWLHHTDDGSTRTWRLPDRLGSLALCDSGKLLLAWDKVMHGTGTGYYNGNVTIGTSSSSGTFRMVDTARPGVQCGGQNGSPYTGPDDVWGNGAGANL